jgi:hypothetical protein
VREIGSRLAKVRSPLDLHRIFQSLMQTSAALRRGSMPDLVLEMGLLKAASLESVETAAEILAELRRVGGAPPATGGAAPGTSGSARSAASKPPQREMSAQKPAPDASSATGSTRTASAIASGPDSTLPSDLTVHSPSGNGIAPSPAAPVSQAEEEGALWEDFLADVRRALGVELYTALSNCEVTLLTDSCLEIRPQLQLFRRRLEQATVLDRVRDVAVARFGGGFDVRLAREGVAAGAGDKPPISLQRIETERQKRIEKEALDDPTVKAAMDLFGGKIEKIQRLDE